MLLEIEAVKWLELQTAMYVRFVIARIDEDSRLPQGVITAAYDLSRHGILSTEGEERFQDIRLWFRAHLRVPKRFSRSQRTRMPGPAVCWFKDNATEAIRRARTLAYLVEDQGLPVEMLLCRRPGYVVYEDALQIAAEPFRPELDRIRRRL